MFKWMKTMHIQNYMLAIQLFNTKDKIDTVLWKKTFHPLSIFLKIQ